MNVLHNQPVAPDRRGRVASGVVKFAGDLGI